MIGFPLFEKYFINFPMPQINYNIDYKIVVPISSHHSAEDHVWVMDTPSTQWLLRGSGPHCVGTEPSFSPGMSAFYNVHSSSLQCGFLL